MVARVSLLTCVCSPWDRRRLACKLRPKRYRTLQARRLRSQRTFCALPFTCYFVSMSLDISQEALDEISSRAAALVSEYFATIREQPVLAPNYAGKTKELVDVDLPIEGRPLDELIDECRTVMDLSRHNGHPRFFGYVASPSTPIGAYADLIASALNANITCWRSGPAGTEIEQLVVRWLGSLIRYDEQANGLLTSGGSMANMIALLIASRRRSNVSRKGLWNSGSPMTVYASEEVHMSISKAADILGIGRDQVRTIQI